MKNNFYTIVLVAIIAAGVSFTSCKKCQTCTTIYTEISSGMTYKNDHGGVQCDREGRAEQKTSCEKMAKDSYGTTTCTCKIER